MKNIDQIMTDLAIDLGDKAEDFKKAIGENYKTVAELENKTNRIAALENELSEAKKTLEGIQQAGANDADALKAAQEQIAAYQRAEDERKAKEDEATARGEFSTKFNEALGDKKFANSLVAKTIEDKAYETAKANPAMNLADIISGIAGDEQGIWKNPQQSVAKMPAQSGVGTDLGHIQSIEDLSGYSEEFINDNWEKLVKLFPKK